MIHISQAIQHHDINPAIHALKFLKINFNVDWITKFYQKKVSTFKFLLKFFVYSKQILVYSTIIWMEHQKGFLWLGQPFGCFLFNKNCLFPSIIFAYLSSFKRMHLILKINDTNLISLNSNCTSIRWSKINKELNLFSFESKNTSLSAYVIRDIE